jgi:hypothetical protein
MSAGLVPLRSTRADVEKLLGRPKNERLNLYGDGERSGLFFGMRAVHAVQITEAHGTCPRILSRAYSWLPKKGHDISFLVGGFWQSFQKMPSYDFPGAFTYMNNDFSITFGTRVQPDGVEHVVYVEYLPKKSDAGLRCPERK